MLSQREPQLFQFPLLSPASWFVLHYILGRVLADHFENRCVLLVGDTGTGKTVFWKEAATFVGKRSEKQFQMGGRDEKWISHALFGRGKGVDGGAFEGILERANGHTALIDEVGDAPYGAMGSLLTFVETGKYTPELGQGELSSNALIFFATNVEFERLRVDLVGRTGWAGTRIPRLEERPEEVPYWLYYFLRKQGASSALGSSFLSGDAAWRLCTWRSWPYNIRSVELLAGQLQGKRLPLNVDALEDLCTRLDAATSSSAQASATEAAPRIWHNWIKAHLEPIYGRDVPAGVRQVLESAMHRPLPASVAIKQGVTSAINERGEEDKKRRAFNALWRATYFWLLEGHLLDLARAGSRRDPLSDSERAIHHVDDDLRSAVEDAKEALSAEDPRVHAATALELECSLNQYTERLATMSLDRLG
jgi:DNA-binding NtrC family response regulator